MVNSPVFNAAKEVCGEVPKTLQDTDRRREKEKKRRRARGEIRIGNHETT